MCYDNDSDPSVSSSASSPSSSERKRRLTTSSAKKSVSFHGSVKVRLTTHINNYTDKEIDACWYSPEDFDAIRADIQTIVNQLQAEEDHAKPRRNRTIPCDDEVCRRGVECKTRKNKICRQQLRMAAWYAVFSEQDLLEEEIYENPSFEPEKCIAHAYSVVSATALSIAHATALRDQLEVEQ